ncbi:MAG: c-type cytochrome [bacterium]|nr:c-type cytochrome [bacterium]
MNSKLLAWCGSLLLIALLGLGIAYQARPWKRLQAEFHELERQQLRDRLAAERARVEEATSELRVELDDARSRLEGRRDEIRQLDDERRRFRHQGRVAEAERRAAQSRIEMLRYRREHADAGRDDDAERARLAAARRQARMEVEAFRELEGDRERQLDELRSELRTLEARWAAEHEIAEDLERRLDELSSGSLIRRLPWLDLLDPTLRIREIAPAGLDREWPGGRVGRVDRCTTCHLGAVREDLDTTGWPPPFQVHPQPDLFVGESSPHPHSRFGCTVCHGGLGRATDFSRAGHRPATSERQAAWGKLREPILPPALVAAGCAPCHPNALGTPRAALLDAGRQLVTEMGCAGCHPVEPPAVRDSLTSQRRGPSLVSIAGKTDAAWVSRWLEAPREFRRTTWMPHLFPETLEGEQGRRRVAEIAAIVAYLWEKSQRPEYEPPAAGDAEAGRELFESVGCTGCHLLDDDDAGRDALFPDFERLHGPNLMGTGSKVNAAWLAAWLRDPSSYRENTPMPDLRLSEKEAADLTAYLMTHRDPEWEALELPAVTAENRDQLVLSHLQETTTIEQSHSRLEAMSGAERNVFLGERSIGGYGCHGCHRIPGFEDTAPIAGDLDRIGTKTLRLLASASRVAEMAHTRRTAADRMPAYGMSEREADAVLVALLGRIRTPVAPWRMAGGSGDEAIPAAGRRVLARYGCRGCHRIEGRGPAIGKTSTGVLPPDLGVEGARVKSSWLFSYLNDPGGVVLRPWLRVRMPTFALTAAESDALVRYFAARSGELLFVPDPSSLAEKDIAVGRVVAVMLQCRRCHGDEPGADGPAVSERAPSFRLVRQRLRPDWVIAWILDPQSWIPGTTMPESFHRDADGRPSSSFLVAAVTSPMFEDQRGRLLPLFSSEEELNACLGDAERVAAALRDYLWSTAD